jgi:hypothetical protein
MYDKAQCMKSTPVSQSISGLCLVSHSIGRYPLNWEVSADNLLELTDFPADFLLVVADTHGEWRGISHACPFDGRAIGAGL